MMGVGPASRFLLAQLCLTAGLFRCIRRTDLVILFPVVMIAPALVAKIFRRPLLLYEAQDVFGERDRGKAGIATSLRYGIIFCLRTVVMKLVDGIAVEGRGVIRQNDLLSFSHKTYRWHQYVDSHAYQVSKQFAARERVVGFLGTLEGRKGILEFAGAVQLVNKKDRTVRFVIGGEGLLKDILRTTLAELILEGTVQVVGSIQESALCHFFNELKLYVLPSTSEGLPNSVLESMACGTPVLATSVGAVPDVISDGVDGFIISTNSPEVIAAAILGALDDPRLSAIAEHSRSRVEEEFSFERSVEMGAEVVGRVGKIQTPFHD